MAVIKRWGGGGERGGKGRVAPSHNVLMAADGVVVVVVVVVVEVVIGEEGNGLPGHSLFLFCS